VKRGEVGTLKAFFFFFWQYWYLIQGLTLAKQAFNHLSHYANPEITFLYVSSMATRDQEKFLVKETLTKIWKQPELGMGHIYIHIYNLNTQEAEKGGPQSQG
jgi:hypothetical protein